MLPKCLFWPSDDDDERHNEPVLSSRIFGKSIQDDVLITKVQEDTDAIWRECEKFFSLVFQLQDMGIENLITRLM